MYIYVGLQSLRIFFSCIHTKEHARIENLIVIYRKPHGGGMGEEHLIAFFFLWLNMHADVDHTK